MEGKRKEKTQYTEKKVNISLPHSTLRGELDEP